MTTLLNDMKKALTGEESLKKMGLVNIQTMSVLQAYLHNPRTQKILNRKPGEKGFSLIELVVVVAVLAILAAIAVPQFSSMNEKAANAAAQTNLKNAFKECSYAQNMGQSLVFTELTADTYFTYTSGTSCGTAASPTTITATTTTSHSAGANKTITISAFDGTKGGTGITGITW